MINNYFVVTTNYNLKYYWCTQLLNLEDKHQVWNSEQFPNMEYNSEQHINIIQQSSKVINYSKNSYFGPNAYY